MLRGADQLTATVHSLLRFPKRLHRRSGQNHESMTLFCISSTSCCTSSNKCEFERTVWTSFSLKCRRFLECTRRMSSLHPPAPPLDLFWAECPRKGGCPRYAPCYASRLVVGRMSSKRWMSSLRLQQTGSGECLALNHRAIIL